MRAAAPLLPHPHAMLDVAESTIRDGSDDMYATAIAAVYDPERRTLTYASAGQLWDERARDDIAVIVARIA
jgi:hypothetical protein